MVVEIINATYLENYKIEFEFSDGEKRTIDFINFLKSSKNPMTKKYLDGEEFKKFKIEFGDIVWNDYEMCFPIWDLHEGNI
ncbi:DUF2442 domain-containing protein [Pedobacter cryotolerans]|uniref:DUF2442 domain-containing protein n=1 Tax=Pedobacter cryotolerans TaxID=2571270 RepID=A0A4V5P1K9_9SPHI|nr:DUF2442 domain-containing protein [Pedobacter cryotolerans]TKC03434.1 DUF2442 domain-containing protein [Pedobacter cryotolerans]